MNELPLTYKNSRKILKAILKNNIYPGMSISLDTLAIYLHTTSTKIINDTKYLGSIGLITIESPQSFSEPMKIKLTEAGYHYFDVRWDRISSFLTKSVLVPIIVSLITTIILKFLF